MDAATMETGKPDLHTHHHDTEQNVKMSNRNKSSMLSGKRLTHSVAEMGRGKSRKASGRAVSSGTEH